MQSSSLLPGNLRWHVLPLQHCAAIGLPSSAATVAVLDWTHAVAEVVPSMMSTPRGGKAIGSMGGTGGGEGDGGGGEGGGGGGEGDGGGGEGDAELASCETTMFWTPHDS